MNSHVSQSGEHPENNRDVALHAAVYELYVALKHAKDLVRVSGSRPKAIRRRLAAIEGYVDTLYTEARMKETELNDLTRIAAEIRRAYDQLLKDTEVAYQDGWKAGWDEALAYVQEAQRYLAARSGE